MTTGDSATATAAITVTATVTTDAAATHLPMHSPMMTSSMEIDTIENTEKGGVTDTNQTMMDIDTSQRTESVSSLPSYILSLTTIDATDQSNSQQGHQQGQPTNSLESKCQEINSHSLLNLTLLDPPKYGWSAGGGIVNVLTPHDRAKRKSAKMEFLSEKRKKAAKAAALEKERKLAATLQKKKEREEALLLQKKLKEAAAMRKKSQANGGVVVGSHVGVEKVNVNGGEGKIEDMKSEGVTSNGTTHTGTTEPFKDVALYPEVQNLLLLNNSSSNSSNNDKPTKDATPPTNNIQEQKMTRSSSRSVHPSQKLQSKISSSTPSTRSINTSTSTSISTVSKGIPDGKTEDHPPLTNETSTQSTTTPSIQQIHHTPSPQDTLSYYQVITELPPESEAKSTTKEKTPKKSSFTKKVIKIQAMDFKTQTLNIHAYHRGIAGVEPRDESSGNLLCETDPVDTNHYWDEPKMKCKVFVSFPLGDLDKSDEEDGDILLKEKKLEGDGPISHRSGNRDVQERMKEMQMAQGKERKRQAQLALIPYYNEEVEWDLSNPCIPTPLAYAGDMAAEYGLSFTQTLDLARSIQNQIDVFVKEHVLYQVPITVLDEDLLGGTPDESSGRQHPVLKVPKMLHGGHCAKNLAAPLSKKDKQLDGLGMSKSRGNAKSGNKANDKASKGSRRRSMNSEPRGDSIRASSKKRRRSNVDVVDVLRESDSTFKEKKKSRKADNKGFTPGIRVPKVPAVDFPVEVCLDRNRDPSLLGDYNTIFTPGGSFVVKDETSNETYETETNESDQNEPSNYIFCHICKSTGVNTKVVNCDNCPRSFCMECLSGDKIDISRPWRCPRCEDDKEEKESDKVSGQKFLKEISPFFQSYANSDPEFDQKVLILCKIYGIILVLRSYDFGEVFAEPVSRGVLDYRIVVDQPMDFGTIKNRLTSKFYYSNAKAACEKEDKKSKKVSLMDHAIWLVLKDIELIWHNCFLYNRKGKVSFSMSLYSLGTFTNLSNCSLRA